MARKSPKSRAAVRDTMAPIAMERTPDEKLADKAHDHISKMGSYLRDIYTGNAIPELKPHQAVFRQRLKNAVKEVLGQGEKKNGKNKPKK